MSAFFLPGCASLRPYQDVVSNLPRGRVVQLSDQRVYVQKWGREGPNIVLLHGFAASSYTFRKLGPLLGEQYQVTAIDLNGFGFTERTSDPATYSIDGQLATLIEVLDRLEISRAAVVGHSYGGQVALHLAEKRPDRVGSVVLISPPTNLNKVPLILRFGFARSALYPFLRLALSDPARFHKLFRRGYHRQEVFTDEVSEEYRKRLLVEGLWNAYQGFGSNLANGPDATLGPDLPILVIAGRHDQIIPLDGLEGFVKQMPQARLEIFEDSGHSSPEEEPETLGLAIEGFLKGQR